MGVYAVVLAEHSLGVLSSDDVVRRLGFVTSTLLRHREIWCKWWIPTAGVKGIEQHPPEDWIVTQERTFGQEVVATRGPFGVWVDITPHICIIHPTPRWGAFVSEKPIRDAVTTLCTSVAVAFASRSLIYLPDSAYCPSRALDLLDKSSATNNSEVLDYLLKVCGPPAGVIETIRRELGDEEMRAIVPHWKSGDEGRCEEYDGYYVATVPYTDTTGAHHDWTSAA